VNDVEIGYATGPFHTEALVSAVVGTDKWLVTPRHAVQQGQGARH
jgi:hypothetical protein